MDAVKARRRTAGLYDACARFYGRFYARLKAQAESAVSG
jgi:hypothetical protein